MSTFQKESTKRLAGRARDSWSKGSEFESRQERRENSPPELTFCAGNYSVSVPPPCYRSGTQKDPSHSGKSAGGRLHLRTQWWQRKAWKVSFADMRARPARITLFRSSVVNRTSMPAISCYFQSPVTDRTSVNADKTRSKLYIKVSMWKLRRITLENRPSVLS